MSVCRTGEGRSSGLIGLVLADRGTYSVLLQVKGFDVHVSPDGAIWASPGHTTHGGAWTTSPGAWLPGTDTEYRSIALSVIGAVQEEAPARCARYPSLRSVKSC